MLFNLNESVKLSFDESETNGYYVRVRFDVLDDDFVIDCIVKFNDKETANVFKMKYESSTLKNVSVLTKSKDGIWLKQYHDKLLETFKTNKSSDNYVCKENSVIIHSLPDLEAFPMTYGIPNKSTSLEDIDTIINKMQEYWNGGYFEKMRISNTFYETNEYIKIINQSIEAVDENELEIYKTNHDKWFCKIDRQEYEKLKKTLSRITKNTDINNCEYFLASDVDKFIYPENFHNCSIIKKISIYDIAIDMLHKISKIFSTDPLNFTTNEEIVRWFNAETLELMNIEIKKYENILDKSNVTAYSNFKNKFIYKRYISYLQELEDLERRNLI